MVATLARISTAGVTTAMVARSRMNTCNLLPQ
jgi:hypothetical protein